MGPKRSAGEPLCQVCNVQPSKYRCSACPTRYCSVPCYKQHKALHEAGPSHSLEDCSVEEVPLLGDQASSAAPIASGDSFAPTVTHPDVQSGPATEPSVPLRRLTALLWPPEPDPSVFTDPLKKEDPKPLRREELLRIATSPRLRTLLHTTSLPSILTALDALPPSTRHSTLSRLLGLDAQSLAAPGGTAASFLSGRDSPPPLSDLLDSISRHAQGGARTRSRSRSPTYTNPEDGPQAGWYLRYQLKGEQRLWIGEEDKRIMRLFAGAVCQAIDGTEGPSHEVAWGQGGLAWEV
ncbi:hypothetical protein IAU60_003239 [Kwoniella sp. DSM 27419]